MRNSGRSSRCVLDVHGQSQKSQTNNKSCATLERSFGVPSRYRSRITYPVIQAEDMTLDNDILIEILYYKLQWRRKDSQRISIKHQPKKWSPRLHLFSPVSSWHPSSET